MRQLWRFLILSFQGVTVNSLQYVKIGALALHTRHLSFHTRANPTLHLAQLSSSRSRPSIRKSIGPDAIASLPPVPLTERSRGTITAVRDDEIEQLAQKTAKSAAIGLRYDPLEADRYWSTRILQVWKRDMEISVPITAFLGKVLIDYQQGMEERNRQLRAREFMSIIASLGPAFIKAGQVPLPLSQFIFRIAHLQNPPIRPIARSRARPRALEHDRSVQALSSRPDLLPPEYLTELQKLQA